MPQLGSPFRYPAFSTDPDKLDTLGVVERLKNSDFILESKIPELNQNQNSEQPDQPDALWKLHFALEINEYHIQHNCLHVFYRIVVLEV